MVKLSSIRLINHRVRDLHKWFNGRIDIQPIASKLKKENLVLEKKIEENSKKSSEIINDLIKNLQEKNSDLACSSIKNLKEFYSNKYGDKISEKLFNDQVNLIVKNLENQKDLKDIFEKSLSSSK